MPNVPFSWPPTGPRDTSARAVLSWAWRWVESPSATQGSWPQIGCTYLVCVLQRYGEAERAMEQVLRLDTDCEEAVMDLMNCRVLQLMVSFLASKGVSCSARLLRMLMSRTSSHPSSFKTSASWNYLCKRNLSRVFVCSLIRNMVTKKGEVSCCWRNIQLCLLSWQRAQMLSGVRSHIPHFESKASASSISNMAAVMCVCNGMEPVRVCVCV